MTFPLMQAKSRCREPNPHPRAAVESVCREPGRREGAQTRTREERDHNPIHYEEYG
jgi:hypothetical protein